MDNNTEQEEFRLFQMPKSRFYYLLQYMMFLFIGMACMMFFYTIGTFIVKAFLGIEVTAEMDAAMLADRNYLNAFRILQVMASFGGFIFSSFLFSLYVKESPVDYLGLKDKPKTAACILVIILMMALIPVLSYLITFANGLSLPASLAEAEQQLRDAQRETTALQQAFMANMGVGDFLFNIFFIALLPAIGEELFFRKVSLRLLFEITRNPHVSIGISALLFALIHGQFFLTIPLFGIGVLLGYLAYWSGTIWLPILAHFCNNFLSLTITYLAIQYPDSPVFKEDYLTPIWITLLFAAVAGIIVFILYKKRQVAVE